MSNAQIEDIYNQFGLISVPLEYIQGTAKKISNMCWKAAKNILLSNVFLQSVLCTSWTTVFIPYPGLQQDFQLGCY